MIWTPITSEADIERLLNLFGGFHDGCLREAHIWTETYVEENLSMFCPGHLDTRVRLLIQRQVANPSAIEMLFEQVIGFHMAPTPDNYDSIIYGATLEVVDGVFFWSDGASWISVDEGTTWIRAKGLSWRDASEWMGDQLRYGPREAA